MSLTRIEKYSERGYILKNPPGRLLIVTYWTALGVWLTPGGRRFEPTKSHFWPYFRLFFFFFFFAFRFASLTVDPLILLSSPSPIQRRSQIWKFPTGSGWKKSTPRWGSMHDPAHIDIGKIVKKHPPLWEAQRVQKSVNPETKKVVRLQNCSRGPDHFLELNFKF